MKILVLEDKGSTSIYMEDALRNAGHDVESASRVSDAQDIWADGDIQCIVADLNLPSDGLTDAQKTQTKGGLLTGWIWLANYVFSENPAFRERTIIYSEYLADLRNSIGEAQRRGVRLVSKRSTASAPQTVLKHLREIAHMGTRGT